MDGVLDIIEWLQVESDRQHLNDEAEAERRRREGETS